MRDRAGTSAKGYAGTGNRYLDTDANGDLVGSHTDSEGTYRSIRANDPSADPDGNEHPGHHRHRDLRGYPRIRPG